MESDCFSGNLPQKVLPGHEVLEGIKQKSSTNFIFLKKVIFLSLSIILRADARRLLYC